MSKKLLCVTGAAALCAAAFVSLLLGSSLIGALMAWLYDIGFLDWLCSGNEMLMRVAPIWAFWLSIVVALFIGLPAYRSCRSYWSRRADSQG